MHAHAHVQRLCVSTTQEPCHRMTTECAFTEIIQATSIETSQSNIKHHSSSQSESRLHTPTTESATMTSVARSRPTGFMSSMHPNLSPVDSSYLTRAVSDLASASQSSAVQSADSLAIEAVSFNVPYAVRHFATYDDYLDSLVQPLDVKYVENEELMRRIVELGHRNRQQQNEAIMSRSVSGHECRAESRSE